MKEFKDSDVEGDGTPANGKRLSPVKVNKPHAPMKKVHVNTGKIYESDKESARTVAYTSSDGGYFDADADSLSDDEDLLSQKISTPSCCSCFGIFAKTPTMQPRVEPSNGV